MATHFVDTDAMEQSTHWLRSHRAELERMVTELRHHIESLMTEAYKVPGGAPGLEPSHQEYQQGIQTMMHGLDAMIEHLQRVVLHYSGGLLHHGGPGTPGTGTPTAVVTPSQHLPMDSHGGMTAAPAPAVVTPIPPRTHLA
jgi:hypothetical protein